MSPQTPLDPLLDMQTQIRDIAEIVGKQNEALRIMTVTIDSLQGQIRRQSAPHPQAAKRSLWSRLTGSSLADGAR